MAQDDVELVWKNCAMYNDDMTSDVRLAGDHCKKSWERFWRESGMEGRWLTLQMKLDPSVSLLKQPMLQHPLLTGVVGESARCDQHTAWWTLPAHQACIRASCAHAHMGESSGGRSGRAGSVARGSVARGLPLKWNAGEYGQSGYMIAVAHRVQKQDLNEA